MIYPIVVYGHPALRKVAEDIKKEYKGLKFLIDSLFDTMYNADGIGLAMPQVGRHERIFVIDGNPAADDEPAMKDFKKTFINAHITERSGNMAPMKESCLSIPGLSEEVNRESHIRITYYDQDWEFHDETYDGYVARVIQHEYDHLDGIVFTDRVGVLRKRLIKGKLTAISKGSFDAHYRTILQGQKLRV
ncbi:MAG: peptide deformylase [Bacteroidales bacterium]|jgi:peptide deformylase|nr:peptide deformylase [Bacteroidales bacterium]